MFLKVLNDTEAFSEFEGGVVMTAPVFRHEFGIPSHADLPGDSCISLTLTL